MGDKNLGVLVLWDLENCRLPEESIQVAELVDKIRARFVRSKSPHTELGFVISMSKSIDLKEGREQQLRYAGAQLRRCLGKKGGKNEEAEDYLASEYHYVKHIISSVGKHQNLGHLILLGGDKDCYHLISEALTDGVQCELLYNPKGTDTRTYLPGLFHGKKVKCYDYFAFVANAVGHQVSFQYDPFSSPVLSGLPGVPEEYSGASNFFEATSRTNTHSNSGNSGEGSSANMMRRGDFCSPDYFSAYLHLPSGFSLATRLNNLRLVRDTASCGKPWNFEVLKCCPKADNAADLIARIWQRDSSGGWWSLGFEQDKMAKATFADPRTTEVAEIQVVPEDAPKGLFFNVWIVESVSQSEGLKAAAAFGGQALHRDADFSKDQSMAVRIKLVGIAGNLTALFLCDLGNGVLRGIHMPKRGVQPSQPGCVLWLSGAQGFQVKEAFGNAN
ncbi:hypothetical protein DUNSADRAFT_13447 [Dunaliella salina]|uniref:NYN domain-containing protein n=1 Tax=Dunaliella salina TaxID=3046 RepID=A0ABQ7G9C4_DUNSA|nr:hypothetical protein DUNSADRAFT_13447 [Dunaliella salina]|eukprot:KAF5831210.1 hypothetical protein DUNSADRAFT_13447 [Dunaliella salina]